MKRITLLIICFAFLLSACIPENQIEKREDGIEKLTYYVNASSFSIKVINYKGHEYLVAKGVQCIAICPVVEDK